MNSEAKARCDIGLIGLGVMGRNLVLNMADHGFSIAAYNRSPEKIEQLEKSKSERQDIHTTHRIETLCRLLRPPRAVILLVSSGEAVDTVIDQLVLHLAPGDLIIDGGNSHFEDTDRRGAALARRDFLFMGMGISGGARGARYGPSIMPGGPEAGYRRVQPILEATAAHVDGAPCVAWLGPGSAGHYVKMVHNGIEYGLMELIAESYDLMRRGLGMHPNEMHTIYDRWNRGVLGSFLIEITARIMVQPDERTGRPLLDRIVDQARQKGTGEWTASEALRTQIPTPNIDTAVMMRHLSGADQERQAAAELLHGPPPAFTGERQPFINRLEKGLHAAFLITFAQGMALLRQASHTYDYGLNLATVARIWRGGCIIRAAVLEAIESAYAAARPGLPHLLLDTDLSRVLNNCEADLRAAVSAAAGLGIPAPGLMNALVYWDAYRSRRLPANLIMAQRDYFGAHTYERVDEEGSFHTQWEEGDRP